MTNRTTALGLLLVLGACSADPAGSSPAPLQSASQELGSEGFKYEHRIERSRFNVGASARRDVEGPYERLTGDKGAFTIDLVTGATLAVRNAMPASAYPQPLTT